jgi:cell division protein FtsN
MARRDAKGTRRDDNPRNGRKGGGLFTGLMIGLAMGIVMAAAVAWYLNMTPSRMKSVDSIPAQAPTNQPELEPEHSKAEQTEPPEAPSTPSRQAKATPPAPKNLSEPQPQPAPKTQTSPPPKSRVNYTFYGILPGDKPARPVELPPSKDTWWLQIAALSDPNKADQIRAKLTLLSLPASTQKIESNGQPLYRIRVGPYKREDDAFGDLDILTQNDFNARLLKDPVNPKK